LKKTGMPRTQLSRKLEFLTESLKTLPSLIKFKDEGLTLLNRAKDLSKHRDIVIHSVVKELMPNSFKLARHIYNKKDKKENKPRLEHSEYTFTDLVAHGKMMQDLAFDFSPFAQRLLKEFAPQLSLPLAHKA